MLVHGAFVPPRAALEELAGVVRSVRRQVEVAPEPQSRRFGRRRAAEPPPGPVEPPLEDQAIERMRLPITGFGNLTTADSHSISAAIAEAAAGWTLPTVRFAGGTALEFPGDRCVWAKLGGDVDALTEVARGVTRCVERLGFYVDRRAFRPMLAIASVTNATIAADLETVVDALNTFNGHDWLVDSVVLTTESFVGGVTATRELERIPLG